MNAKEVVRREKEHFEIITQLEKDLKSAVDESRRTAIGTKISQENAAFRKFSITVLREKVAEIDRTLKRYATDKAGLERQIGKLDDLQKILLADRVRVAKALKELGENI